MDNFELYRLGQFLALRVPLMISYAIAVLVSDIRYIFAKEDRRRVFENLKVIFPHKSGRELRSIRLRMFRNFAKYLVDFFRFSVIDEKYLKR
jgi:KDO2-lipid IV(A) lauroyltransferase